MSNEARQCAVAAETQSSQFHYSCVSLSKHGSWRGHNRRHCNRRDSSRSARDDDHLLSDSDGVRYGEFERRFCSDGGLRKSRRWKRNELLRTFDVRIIRTRPLVRGEKGVGYVACKLISDCSRSRFGRGDCLSQDIEKAGYLC